MFYGDVRKYYIFKSDFKCAIEDNCSERETMGVNSSPCSCEPVMMPEDREGLRIVDEKCELSDKYWVIGYP